MSTYTGSLGLEEITPGDQAGLWGNTTNNNLALIDQAVTGVTPISFAGLSGSVKILESSNGALDEARAAVLNIFGLATGTNTVVVPNRQKTYLVRNDTGRSVIFRTATPGLTYPVEAGNSILIFCDGDNNVFTGIQSQDTGTLTVPGGGTGVITFGGGGFVKSPGAASNLIAVASVALGSADVSGTLPILNGGTGLNNFPSGSILRGAGTVAPAVITGTAGVGGQVLTWSGSQWEPASPAASGISSISAGAGITVNGGTGPVTSGPVTIATSGSVTSVSVTSPVVNNGSSTAPNIGISSSPTFSGGVTAGGFLTTGTIQANAGFNWTSNTSMAFNSGASILQIAINGQSAATFNTTNGIVSSSALTTGVNPAYFNTQAYVSSNALGVNGTGIPANAGIYYDAVATGWVISGGAGRINYVATNSFFACGSDNGASSGFSNLRWSQVYAINGSINTSDVSEKTEIADLDEAEKRVATRIKGLIKKFKWKDSVAKKGSDGARIHVGVIAQEVKAAFEAEGLDAHRYGMFCYDEWEAQSESVSSNGAVLQKTIPAGARYGVRYEELLAFVIAAL
jgi:hypothetical protein